MVVLFVRFGRDSDELTESTRDSVRFGLYWSVWLGFWSFGSVWISFEGRLVCWVRLPRRSTTTEGGGGDGFIVFEWFVVLFGY